MGRYKESDIQECRYILQRIRKTSRSNVLDESRSKKIKMTDKIVIGKLSIVRVLLINVVMISLIIWCVSTLMQMDWSEEIGRRYKRDRNRLSIITLCLVAIESFGVRYIAHIMFSGVSGLFIRDRKLIFLSEHFGDYAYLESIKSIVLPEKGTAYHRFGMFYVHVRGDFTLPMSTLLFATSRSEMLDRLEALGLPVIRDTKIDDKAPPRS
jgi:hypothetical protein